MVVIVPIGGFVFCGWFWDLICGFLGFRGFRGCGFWVLLLVGMWCALDLLVGLLVGGLRVSLGVAGFGGVFSCWLLSNSVFVFG